MKLQKVFVVLGISTCLLAAEIQGTFGMEEDAQEEEAGQAGENQEPVPEEPIASGTESEFQVSAEAQPVSEPEKPAEVQPEPEEIQPVPELEETQPAPEPGEPEETQPAQEPGEPEETQPVPEPGEPEETQPAQEPGETEESQPVPELPEPGEPEEIQPAPGPEEPEKTQPAQEPEKSEEAQPAPEPAEQPDTTKSDAKPQPEPDTKPEQQPPGQPGDAEIPADGQEAADAPVLDGGENNSGKEDISGEGDISEGEGKADNGDAFQEDAPAKEDILEGEENEAEDEAGSSEYSGDTVYNVVLGYEDEAADWTADYSNLFGTFAPSSEFIDNREKIKYNVEMPIEGLPKFITAEMVIGALKCQDETGYPASVTIAQIIQESGFGKYGPEGDKGQGLSYLAFQYNNLFGIKGTGPAGSVDMGTGEQNPDGSTYRITAGFRVYHTYTECIEDRAKLLDEVYSDLTFGVKDANTFAVKIGKRWATSLTYGQNLIQQMKQYDLYRLDEMTVDEFSDMLGTFVNPCPGSVLTSSFGYRTAPMAGASTYHKGIDLGTGMHNIPTYAAQKGTVIYAGEGGAEGLYIAIAHENGLVTKYMHHDKIYVKTGDEVEKGQQIGLSGSTGNSTGNHLHFQVEENGKAVDPLLYLNIQ